MKPGEIKHNLIGKRFGRWLVEGLSHQDSNGLPYWHCICDCGARKAVRAASLLSGRSTSCGCYHKEKVSIHNMTGVPTFISWSSMKNRCTNQNSPDYYRYGGIGIKICDRWMNSFDNFLADMGERPKGLTLDRIDNEGDYTPENCRWATTIEQLSNRRNTVKIDYNGKKLTLRELSEISGMKIRVIRDRINAGWPTEKALFTKNRKQPNRSQ